MTPALLASLLLIATPRFVTAQRGSAAVGTGLIECRRPPARQFTQGETVVLKETAKFPCRIEIVNTPVALRGDADPAVEDFGQYVARSPDGRFFTSSRRAELYVWSPTGQFLRTFGKQGKGPGELSGGGVFVDFMRDGSMYLADHNNRWSVYTPALEYTRTISSVATGTAIGETGFFTAEGLFVGSDARVAQSGNAFAVVDLSQSVPDGAPRLVRAFGTLQGRGPRKISPSAGMNFWAAPPDGAGGGYTLELWRTDGTHLRTIRRDVPWFPGQVIGGDVPPPEMEIVHDDGTGVLFVGVMVPNAAKWREVSASRGEGRGMPTAAEREKQQQMQNEMIDIYLEAIDGNSGVVLASWGPYHPLEALKKLPLGLFPRSRTGYRKEEDANGFSVMRIVELKLIAQ